MIADCIKVWYVGYLFKIIFVSLQKNIIFLSEQIYDFGY